MWLSPIGSSEILLQVDRQSIRKILTQMTIGPGERHTVKITAKDDALTSQTEKPGT